MQNDVLYNRIMKKIDELEPGGGSNIPIYSIYSEGSSISYCHIIGDFTEAHQNWQNNVPILFTISQNVGTGDFVYSSLALSYKYDTDNDIFIIWINSVSGFNWSAEGIEYWED